MEYHNDTQRDILEEADTAIINALDSFRLYSTRLGELAMKARSLDEGRGRTIEINKTTIDSRIREIEACLGSLEMLYFTSQGLEEDHQIRKFK